MARRKSFLLALAVALCLVLGALIGFSGALFLSDSTSEESVPEPCFEPVEFEQVEMTLPAVNANGTGIIASLTTTLREGEGRVLVRVDELLSGYELQYSARNAAGAAENFTGVSLGGMDVIYEVEADASSIDGPSAGAAMAVSTVAVLKGVELNHSIMMTGSVDSDGSIGPASGISEKARVSKENNALLFLVPLNQTVEGSLEKQKECTVIDSVEYCDLDYVPGSLGIQVRQVKDLAEAWGYFE
jgi:uncharacterized protein